jgi:hypothetical protein
MLVKARRQIVSNPRGMHEVLSKVLGAESVVSICDLGVCG